MAISVTTVGTNFSNSGVGGATVVITVGVGGVPAGSVIVVGACEANSSANSGTVTDSAGNTYTAIVGANLNANITIARATLYYAKNSAALVNGNTITYTKETTLTECAVSALYATGLDTTSPLDTAVTASSTGSTTTPSVTSGTPAVSGELFIGAVMITGGSGTFTQDAAFVTPFDEAASGTGGGNRRVNGGNLINAGTGTKTYAPTYGTAHSLAAFIVGFKPLTSTGIPWFQPPNGDRTKVQINIESPPAMALGQVAINSSPYGWAHPPSEWIAKKAVQHYQPSSFASTSASLLILGWQQQQIDQAPVKVLYIDRPVLVPQVTVQIEAPGAPGSGKHKNFPAYTPQPAYDVKKRAPVQPIWDRYRRAKQDEERARLDALARLPVPMPPASLFPAPQPVSYPQPTQFAPHQVDRIARQSRDAQDIADLQDVASMQSQDVSDLQDVTDIMNLIGLE